MSRSSNSIRLGAVGSLCVGLLTSCGGDPCSGADCAEGTKGTGPYTPRQKKPAGQIERLDEDQCVMRGSTLQLHPGKVLFVSREIDGMLQQAATIPPATPFLIFWNVCNVGNVATSVSVAQTLFVRPLAGGDSVHTAEVSTPPLSPCHCSTPEVNVGGLPQGNYRMTVEGPAELAVSQPLPVRP